MSSIHNNQEAPQPELKPAQTSATSTFSTSADANVAVTATLLPETPQETTLNQLKMTGEGRGGGKATYRCSLRPAPSSSARPPA